MKSRIKWVEDRIFAGTTASGHSLVFGAPGETGLKPGPSPMELILMGAGGCTAYDVIELLEKDGEQIESFSVELEAERAAEAPKVFTRIHIRFIAKGRGLTQEKVESVVKLSSERLCSATAMLEKTAVITQEIVVNESVAEA